MQNNGITHMLKKILPQDLVHRLGKLALRREYERTKALDPSQYRSELGRWFNKATGETLDVDNPVTFNQKVQWLKLYDSTEEKGRLADKYLVRSWIAEQLGQEYLVPLLGEWPDASHVDFDALPDSFVLKVTLGSGTNLFVRNKSQLDIAAARRQLDEWMHTDFAFARGTFELHYTLVEPRIIAEEYMDFASEPTELVDYRFFCSWGNVFSVWCDAGSATHEYRRSIFTPNWEELKVKATHEIAVPALPKPKHYEEMLDIARKLSADFALARVDLYEYRDQVRFGEITFTPQMGCAYFEPESFNEWMGSNIKLPAEKKPFKGMML